MTLDQAVLQLDAAAEPSRLRLLVALLGGECGVGDLVTVLEQSQPRVSRHLRLLAEAGLLESFREGRSIYYRWSDEGLATGVAGPAAALGASDDPAIVADRGRLQALCRQRERDALRRTLRAGQARSLHAPDTAAAIADLLPAIAGARPPGDVLVIGCGSGELLQLLLPVARTVWGTEPSAHRRQVARARLRRLGLPRWSVRAAEPAQLPFAAGSFDLVICQDVLGPGADVRQVLAGAGRVLRPDGRLLIVDRILPTDNTLSAQLAALGFAVAGRHWLPGREPDRALFEASRADTSPARTGTND